MSKKLAKLSPPRFTVIYPRQRLFKKLDDWSDTAAIWVQAPAGSGKTTLIASYLQNRKKPVTWYQLDADDKNPANFFYYLALMQPCDLPVLTPEYRLGGIQTFAREFFRNFYRELPDRSVWVLDNYQLASTQTLDDVIDIALQEIPPGLQVILISREPPPPPLARLLTTPQLHVLNPVDIYLTEDETQGICKLHLPGSANPLPHTLYDLTRGWAAGVMLLLEQEKHGATLSARIKTDTQQTLFDYFAGEVLQRASAELQDILLKTAFIPHITIEMAVALSSNPQAGELLNELATRNYFTYRHEDETLHFEYHPLFSEFLRKQAQCVYDQTALTQLCRQSAQLLADAGRHEQAFKLYHDIQDWPVAIELILSQAQAFLEQGRDQIIYQWLQQLPPSVVMKQPWLMFWLGASTLATDPNESYRHFELAFQLFQQQNDLQGTLFSWMGAVDSVVYSLSKGARLDRWLQEFEKLQRNYPLDDIPQLQGQLASRMMGMLILRQPDHPDVNKWYDKAVNALSQIDNINQRMFNGFYLFAYNIWRGELAKAAALLEGLVQGNPADFPPLAATTCYFGRAWLAWSRGDYELCQTNINQGLATAQQTGVYVWYGMSLMMGSTNAFIHSMPEVAEAYLQQLTPEIFSIRDMDKAYYYNDRAAFRLAAGDALQAYEDQKLAIRMAEDCGVIYTLADTFYGMALVQHALGDHAWALRYLQQADEHGKRYRSSTKAIQCALLRAQFALEAKDEHSALTILQAVFEQIRTKGFVTYNSWQPTAIARLFAFCLRHNICNDIIISLIKQYHLTAPADETSPAWPWPVRIWTLGRFSVLKDEQPIRFESRAQKKPFELLKVLLAKGGRDVSEETLSEALWPDADGDAAHSAFSTTLSRLRKLLGQDALLLRDGKLSLNNSVCWVDVWSVERAIRQLEQALVQHQDATAIDAILQPMLNLCHGDFLQAETAAWVLASRERIKGRVLAAIKKLIAASADCKQVITLYEKALQLDPLSEANYRGLMACLAVSGDPSAAMALYNRCRNTLDANLGIEPAATTRELAEAISRQELDGLQQHCGVCQNKPPTTAQSIDSTHIYPTEKTKVESE